MSDMKPRFLSFVALTLLALASDRCHADKPLPRHVDLSGEFSLLGLPARTQGQRDVCSLFAITALANFESARTQSQPHTQLSEEFLIWAAKKTAGKLNDQAMFYEAVAGLNQFGICTERLMPYNPRPGMFHLASSLAEANAAQLSQRWVATWIKRWDVKNPLSDHQLQEIKQALAAHHPVACGMRWPKKDMGYHLLTVPRPTDVEDGHSIVLTGYTDDETHPQETKFFFRNSSGPGWGQNGYGQMSAGYLRAYANDALWLQMGRESSEVPTWRFEAESAPIVGSRKCETSVQNMRDYRSQLWSGNTHLFCGASKGGDVELAFDVTQAGRYRLRVLATAAPDFGIVRIGFPGASKRSHDFDLYSGRVSPSGSLELGTSDFNAARYVLRFTSIDKNRSSTGYRFGVDAIDLIAAK